MSKKRSINLPRRRFIAGAGAAATATGVGLGFSQAVNAGSGSAPTKLFVYLFLRGGIDGLSFVVPTGGANFNHYAQDRDATFIEPNEPLNLFGSQFGLHPFCTALHSIAPRVAIVHACGHPLDALTRSHFDAQETIELGTPGNLSGVSGFLNRYLQTQNHSPDAIFTALASSSNPPTSMAGYPDIATLDSAGGFSPNSGTFADTHLMMLDSMYSGTGSLDLAAQSTVDAVNLINSFDLDDYQPAGGVSYPNTGLGSDLALIAQLWKLDLGISTATVDRGGWDTHNTQNTLNPNGGFGRNIAEVSDAVTAFYLDIANDPVKNENDICLVIQSEFGRQVSENGNAGTDHGYADPMVLIGGLITGGLYGTFPSIATGDRIGDGVMPTTDFRNVHATVMDRVLGNGPGVVSQVFPDLNYQPVF
ncbi:MAG: DUF1501 domain-containing protein [Pseudomonadota bacterium]